MEFSVCCFFCLFVYMKNFTSLCIQVVECHPLAEQKCETIRVRASKPGKFPDVRLLKFFPGIKAQYVSLYESYIPLY